MPPRRRSWVQRNPIAATAGLVGGAVLIAPPIRRSLARALGVASDAAPAAPDTAGVGHSPTKPLSSGPQGEPSPPQPSIGTVASTAAASKPLSIPEAVNVAQAAKKWRESSSSGAAKESTAATAASGPLSVPAAVKVAQAAAEFKRLRSTAGSKRTDENVDKGSTRKPEEEEEEEESDTEDANEADDARREQFLAQLKENQAKREQDERQRREELKKAHAEKTRETQQKLATELAVINAQNEEERKKAAAERDAILEASKTRTKELTFDFSFN